mmetsp:Transcript_127129/g.220351  ORF Transcript_127129/g.220351 Transcript_127129/m.220351 type:complete len:210 (+) Transcript_127129:712-1341(+)
MIHDIDQQDEEHEEHHDPPRVRGSEKNHHQTDHEICKHVDIAPIDIEIWTHQSLFCYTSCNSRGRADNQSISVHRNDIFEYRRHYMRHDQITRYKQAHQLPCKCSVVAPFQSHPNDGTVQRHTAGDDQDHSNIANCICKRGDKSKEQDHNIAFVLLQECTVVSSNVTRRSHHLVSSRDQEAQKNVLHESCFLLWCSGQVCVMHGVRHVE